jgi:hypothetical protein
MRAKHGGTAMTANVFTISVNGRRTGHVAVGEGRTDADVKRLIAGLAVADPRITAAVANRRIVRIVYGFRSADVVTA